MNPSQILTLKNGYEIDAQRFDEIINNVRKAEMTSFVAFYDLIKKCRNVEHVFQKTGWADSRTVLQEHHLIDENEAVYRDVKEIIWNLVSKFDQPLTCDDAVYYRRRLHDVTLAEIHRSLDREKKDVR